MVDNKSVSNIGNNNLNDAVNIEVSSGKKKTDLNLFSVDILNVVKEAQAQHGLRHGDYHRYHGYCTRRLKRIRSFLKFRMGDKRRVTPKLVTQNMFTDSRYIQIYSVYYFVFLAGFMLY